MRRIATRQMLLAFGAALALLPAALHAQVSVLGDLVYERAAAAGTAYEGTIQIRNETDAFQEVKIYQTDYLFYADGTNHYGEPGSHPRSNAAWIDYGADVLTIAPQQTQPFTFRVTVPAADSLAGTYWSLLMVEGLPPGSAESTLAPDAEKKQLGLRTTIRYGFQVVTHLSGTGTPAIAFSNTKLLAGGAEERVLQVDLVNEGDLAARPKVWVELFDATGAAAGRFDGESYRIYPGTSIRNRIPLGTLDGGEYKALVFVDAGGEDLFGAQYTLQL